jgi:ABC-type Fe3+-hydroxamate transport system substrate-binding protein
VRTHVAIAALVVALAGCGSSSPEAEPTTTTARETTTTTTVAESPDRTADLKARGAGTSWAAKVTRAVQPEPGRLTVETSIVDPRSAGSAEAAEAIAICNAGVALLQDDDVDDPKVTVAEADGSTFVVYGHPSYPGGCSET